MPAPAPTIPTAAPRRLPPLLGALGWVAADLVSTLAFSGLFALTHSALASTLLGLAVGAGQIAWERGTGRPVAALQLLSLVLVAVAGTASLMTHDARFVMLKATVVYAAVGAAMLQRGWMVRYMPERALRWSSDVVVAFGYAWAALMFATAAVNAGLALWAGPRVWGVFIATAPLATKATMILVQYATTRAISIRRARAAAVA